MSKTKREIKEVRNTVNSIGDLNSINIEEYGNEYVVNYNDNEESEISLVRVSKHAGNLTPVFACIKKQKNFDPKANKVVFNEEVSWVGRIAEPPHLESILPEQIDFHEVLMTTVDKVLVHRGNPFDLSSTVISGRINRGIRDEIKEIMNNGRDYMNEAPVPITPWELEFNWSLKKFNIIIKDVLSNIKTNNSNVDIDIIVEDICDGLSHYVSSSEGDMDFIKFNVELHTSWDNWELRAVEHQVLGLYENKPSTAAVAALLENGLTNKEISEELGVASSTVSQQVERVEEMKKRAVWHTQNQTS